MMVLPWLIGGLLILCLIIAALVIFTAWIARRVERHLPPHGNFVDVNGGRLHYIDAGAGPVIVMVHGLAGQSRNFTHSLVDLLKNDYRVVVIDRPGSGYSTRSPDASAALDAQADVIAHFIASLDLGKPLVVGHSLGGAISLALALNHPDRVGGLALIAPVTHPQDEVPPLFAGLVIRSPILRQIVAWTMATPASIAGRKAGLAAIFGPQAAPDSFATKGGALLGLRPCNFINASRDLVTAPEDIRNLAQRYHQLTLPVGVIYGTGDRILDYRMHGEAMATKIPGLDLELIEDGGHMILIASANRTAEFIRRIAQRLAAGTNPSTTITDTR